MSVGPEFRAAAPRVVRLELADLYVGDGTAAVLLDGLPCDTWIKALRATLATTPGLEQVRLQIEGAWLHFVGMNKAGTPLAARLMDVMLAASHRATVPAPALAKAARPLYSATASPRH